MKSEETIRYIAISNLVERRIAIEYAPKRDKLSKFQSAVNDIVEKLILISITANERHTESINDDLKILSVVDKSVRWCFVCITEKSFPERIGYQLLSELESKSLKTLNTKFFNLSTTSGKFDSVKTYSDDIQLTMVELHRKFRDPGNVDRLHLIQRDINDIKKDMNQNLTQMVKNVNDAAVLETKSEKIKLMGDNYRKNAQKLEKATRWGNWKLNLAIGGVATSGIGYFIYAMFFK